MFQRSGVIRSWQVGLASGLLGLGAVLAVAVAVGQGLPQQNLRCLVPPSPCDPAPGAETARWQARERLRTAVLYDGDESRTDKGGSRAMPRTVAITALALLTLAVAPGAEEPAPKGDDPRLQAILRDWEKASDATAEMHCTFRQTEVDAVFDTTTVTRGEVWVKKPGLGRVDLRDDKGEPSAIWLWKEKEVRLYRYQTRTVVAFHVPPMFGFPERPEEYPDHFLCRLIGGQLESLSWMSVGFPVGQLTTRFQVRLGKEDEHWIYLEVEPKGGADRAEFRKMRVVLDKKAKWVRQLWFERLDGGTIRLDYEQPVTDKNQPITWESILPDLPRGWERLTAPEANRQEP
jgi:TIGR03009 family protein